MTLLVIVGVVWIFNPYMAHRWRTCVERWTTRERSHGHPFYWLMRYGDKDSAYDHDADWQSKSYIGMHKNLYNRPAKQECNVKNVIYIE